MSNLVVLLCPKGNPIHTQDQEFVKGYELGYRYYVTTCSHLPILDIGIYEFLVGTIISVRHSGRWNAGAIVGWIAALLDHEKEQPEHKDTLILGNITVGNGEPPTC